MITWIWTHFKDFIFAAIEYFKIGNTLSFTLNMSSVKNTSTERGKPIINSNSIIHKHPTDPRTVAIVSPINAIAVVKEPRVTASAGTDAAADAIVDATATAAEIGAAGNEDLSTANKVINEVGEEIYYSTDEREFLDEVDRLEEQSEEEEESSKKTVPPIILKVKPNLQPIVDDMVISDEDIPSSRPIRGGAPKEKVDGGGNTATKRKKGSQPSLESYKKGKVAKGSALPPPPPPNFSNSSSTTSSIASSEACVVGCANCLYYAKIMKTLVKTIGDITTF